MTKNRVLHRWDPVVSKILGAACVKYGNHVDYDRLAGDARISASTLRRRMNEPDNLSLGELVSLSRALGLNLVVRLEKPGE